MERGIRTLTTLWLAGALLSVPAAATTPPSSTRHPQLCGVEFENGSYRFGRADGTPHGQTIEWLASPGGSQTLLMRFDAPADFVDFVARVDEPSAGPMRSELIAFDENGKVVDSDSGRAQPGELTTMQVVTEDVVIREVHFRFKGAADSARVQILDLDIGASLGFCRMKS